MNLKALNYIFTNKPKILDSSAKNNTLNPNAVRGIAIFAAENGYKSLSINQKHYFDNSIRVLIENVPCESYSQRLYGKPDKCVAILKDEDLVQCYQSNTFYCIKCKSEAARDTYLNKGAHAKAFTLK